MNIARYEEGTRLSRTTTTSTSQQKEIMFSKEPSGRKLDPPGSRGPQPPVMPSMPDSESEEYLVEDEVPSMPKAVDVSTPSPLKAVDVSTPSTPTTAAESPSVKSTSSKRSPGEVIVLGGTKGRSRSSERPKTRNNSSYELRESKSADDAKFSSPRKATAIVGGAAVVGGAAAGAAVATRGSGESPRGVASFVDDAEVPSGGGAYEKGDGAVVPPEQAVDTEKLSNISPKALDKDPEAVAVPVMNHNFTSQPKKSFLGGMSRPAMAAVVVAGSAAIGLGAFTAVRLPDLNSQVRDLEEQVDRLESLVVDLTAENDRFETSNNVLNSTIFEFEEENEFLNDTSIRLAQSVDDLEGEIGELSEINQELQETNDKIEAQNSILNETNQELMQDVIVLNDTVTDLQQDFDTLLFIQENLESNITELDNLLVNLTLQEAELEEQVDALEAETEILNATLSNLSEAIVFLNETVAGSDEELVNTTAALSEAIEVNRFLGVERLNYIYLDLWHGWDCDFANAFPTNIDNPIVPIPETGLESISRVLDVIDDTITRHLCFNRTDLEFYLDRTYRINFPLGIENPPLNEMTTEEVIDGVNVYTQAGLDFYFPPQGELGLTPADWEAAGYECSNIEKFVFPLPSRR